MEEEKPKTAVQKMIDELRRQQNEVTLDDVLRMVSSPGIKVSAGIGSPKGDKTGVCVLQSTAQAEQDRLKFLMMENPVVNSYKPVLLPWWDLGLRPDLSLNPFKKFNDDGEIHINVKKRNIKFNFKN